MIGNPAQWFGEVPHELAVSLLSMIPITEIRAAIPIGIEVYDLPAWKALLFGVLGNAIIAAILLALVPIFHDWVLKQKFIGRILKKKLHSAEKAFKGKYTKWGSVALVLFVGIPLPMTGVWTGSLAAFIFGIPFKKSFPLITLGTLLAGVVVTLITLSAGEIIRSAVQ